MYTPYSLADTAEIMLLELNQLQTGPQFLIHHRFQTPGQEMLCGAGEEFSSVELLFRGQTVLLALPLSLLFVFECLARSRHTPRSATQIAATIRSSDLYRKHGINSGIKSSRRITRSAIKTYVHRIRQAMNAAFEKAGTPIDANQVLVSEETVGNQALYRLRATVTWIHTKI